MATIYLIRHGQASFGMANYDQLSETGKKQAAFLSGHFEKAGKTEAPYLFTGSMERHRQTVAHGFPAADFSELRGLNEFNHEEVLRVYRPDLFGSPPAEQSFGLEEIKKFMRTAFPLALQQWIKSGEAGAYTESFSFFKGRCMEAFRHMLSEARQEGQKKVIAVTSGGFIALVMTQVLRMPDEMFPEINLNIANASVTAFLFNEEKVSLAYFNNYSHLPQELLTFR